MPAEVEKARSSALYDLYYGPTEDEDYETNLGIIRDWIEDEMPHSLYYEEWSGQVSESEPEGFEDPDTGEWVEPDWSEIRRYDKRDIMRIVFGALMTEGGL